MEFCQASNARPAEEVASCRVRRMSQWSPASEIRRKTPFRHRLDWVECRHCCRSAATSFPPFQQDRISAGAEIRRPGIPACGLRWGGILTGFARKVS